MKVTFYLQTALIAVNNGRAGVNCDGSPYTCGVNATLYGDGEFVKLTFTWPVGVPAKIPRELFVRHGRYLIKEVGDHLEVGTNTEGMSNVMLYPPNRVWGIWREGMVPPHEVISHLRNERLFVSPEA